MGLTLSGIGYAYSAGTAFGQRALDDVTFTVEPGELVLVLGATGSGKSTLLRIAAGLLEAGAGSATLDGRPLTRDSARGSVGLVFQDAESQLFAETVADDVAFGPRNLGWGAEESTEESRRALLAVELDPEVYSDRSPFSLSGGEARRAAIAGVLAMRPRYLLLDEPTAGLDAPGRRAVRRIVEAARIESGVVVVSHSAEEFLGIADRAVVLSCAGVAFAGSADSLIAAPETFARSGLVAPDVLQVQMAARAKGAYPDAYTLDPVVAARRIASAGGWG